MKLLHSSNIPPRPDVQSLTSVPSPLFQTPHLAQRRSGESMLRATMHMPELCIAALLSTSNRMNLAAHEGVSGNSSVYLCPPHKSAITTTNWALNKTHTVENVYWQSFIICCCFKVPMETTKHMIFDQLFVTWLSSNYFLHGNGHGSYSQWRLSRESHVEGVRSSSLSAQWWTMKYPPPLYAENNGHSCNFFSLDS